MALEKEKSIEIQKVMDLTICVSDSGLREVRKAARGGGELKIFADAVKGIRKQRKPIDGNQDELVPHSKDSSQETSISQVNKCVENLHLVKPRTSNVSIGENDVFPDRDKFLDRLYEDKGSSKCLTRSFSAPHADVQLARDHPSRGRVSKDYGHNENNSFSSHSRSSFRDQDRNRRDRPTNRPQFNHPRKTFYHKEYADNFPSRNSHQQSQNECVIDHQDNKVQEFSSPLTEVKEKKLTSPVDDDIWEDVDELQVDCRYIKQDNLMKGSTPITNNNSESSDVAFGYRDNSEGKNVCEKIDNLQEFCEFQANKSLGKKQGVAAFQAQRQSSSKISQDTDFQNQNHATNNYGRSQPIPDDVWDEDFKDVPCKKGDSDIKPQLHSFQMDGSQSYKTHLNRGGEVKKNALIPRNAFNGNLKKTFDSRNNRNDHHSSARMASTSRLSIGQQNNNSNYRNGNQGYVSEPSNTDVGQSKVSCTVEESDVWEEIDQSQLELRQLPEISTIMQNSNQCEILPNETLKVNASNVISIQRSELSCEKPEEGITSELSMGSSHDNCTTSYSPLSPSSNSSTNKPGEKSFEYEPAEGDSSISTGEDRFSFQHISAITDLLHKILEERGKIEVDIEKVKQDINKVLYKDFEGCKVDVYGSQYSGYALNTSNINLELVSKFAESVNKRYLRAFADGIEKRMPEYFARVEDDDTPYCQVSCIEPQCGTSCDIAFLGRDSSFVRNSEMIKQILMVDNRVKPLVIALRHWAEVCSIHEPEKGSLHALALVLMTIYFLQRHNPPVLPVIDITKSLQRHTKPQDNKQDLGLLWIYLLKFYSQEFSWREHVISLTASETVLKQDKQWKKYWIAIEDPMNPKNNVAKRVSSQDVSNYIQICFSQSYQYFSKPPEISNFSDHYSDKGEDLHNFQYTYSFDEKHLAGKISMPHSCIECEELGYMCDDCAEEEEDIMHEFPILSEDDMEPINIALREAYDEHALKEEDIRKRLKFVNDLQHYTKERFRDAKLELIGSSMNGFGFHNSDLDICMTFEGIKEIPQDRVREIIKNLCFHLRRNKEFNGVFALHSAKIPIVAFHHIETDFRGDISLYNILACHNTSLIRMYSQIDERAKILGFCLKLVAKKACIADTAQKSLSSYSYVLMAIHFLQRTDPPILPALQELTNEEKFVEGCNVAFQDDLNILQKIWSSQKNKASVAELWLEMLRYYIMDIDINHVISIRRGNIIPKSNSFRRSRMFSIEDPFISIKNLGSVMSEQMSVRTYKALVRARKLFGTPLKSLPAGCKNFQDYYFDSMSLTDGLVVNLVECALCGKQGHVQEKCGRYNLNNRRGCGSYRGRYNRGNFRGGNKWNNWNQ